MQVDSYPPEQEKHGGINLHEAFEECVENVSYQLQDSVDSDADDNTGGKCLYEDYSDGNDESKNYGSQACEDDIASIITEPIMAWDLEHDGIFEV